MAKKNNIDLSELENHIKKYTKDVMRVTAGKIRDDLTEEAFTSIVKFYTSYSPKYYHRHYYNFMENSFKKYYANPHSKIYYGGVELTPEAMDNIYQDSTEEVFESVYAGFHGPASMIGGGYATNLGIEPRFFHQSSGKYTYNIPERMKPSPIESLYIKQNEIENNIQDYIDYAQSRVNI